ncbi:MAG: chromosome partitioning protein ParB, partial [Candidatus Moranbacteria bacterium CG17_big_fil_post_rev_8_21_14_2_50_44_12]
MANNNSGLGRGLASLIPQKNKPVGDAGASQNIKQEIAAPPLKAVQDEFLEVAIGKIATNPQQPRHDFAEGELQDLAAS